MGTVRTSVCEDAVLQLLLGAGLDREQAATLVGGGGGGLGQSPGNPDHREQSSPLPVYDDQRSETDDTQHRSSFKSTVMAMMERMSQRLGSLLAKVEESGRAPNHL